MENESEPPHNTDNKRTPAWVGLAIAALGISARLILAWMGS